VRVFGAAKADVIYVCHLLDSNPARHGELVHGLPVLGGPQWLADPVRASICVIVGAALRRSAA